MVPPPMAKNPDRNPINIPKIDNIINTPTPQILHPEWYSFFFKHLFNLYSVYYSNYKKLKGFILVSKFLKSAIDNFFCNILGFETSECKTKKFQNFYCSKVSIFQNDMKYDAIFLFKKDTVNLISKNLLFEENLDEKAFVDLLKKTANLIGGTAKTMMEEFDDDSSYKLSTPEYLGFIKNLKELDLTYHSASKINNRCFVLGLKEV